MQRRRFLAGTGLLMAAWLPPAAALAAQKEAEVTRLPKPLPVETPGRIEVIEFFWYGCPHCASLEAPLAAWEKRLPRDVAVRREHVVWAGRKDTEAQARLYLTLRAMNLLAKYHGAAFDALHNAKAKLRDDAEIIEWAARSGIDRAKFEATYKSFGMNAQTSRARDMTFNYGIDSVPSFVVNGKHLTSLGAARSPERLFAILDTLIAGERAAKKQDAA